AVILPDEGYRYENTVYDDEWLAPRGLMRDALPAGPVEWDAPRDGDDEWACFRWERRTYAEVMGVQEDCPALAAL
ncbi:MAG: cysteine synthase family protein, partial [Gemmatimonadetes bacterium]|nr:cysteine synthase family protein [Gemmatimonadota bacterium]